MALNQEALEVLAPHLRAAKVLSLGYPDLLITAGACENLFGVKPAKFTNNGQWHKFDHPIPETVELLRLLSSTIECIDIHASMGVEKLVDLNEKQSLGSYDLVIDAGTVEHCFNVGQAILNAANAVRQGGRIFHVPPMTMVNHGFYNLSPTLLWDFYRQNDWTVEHFSAHTKHGPASLHPTARFQAQGDSWMFFLARRNTHKPFKFPMQTKYMKKYR